MRKGRPFWIKKKKQRNSKNTKATQPRFLYPNLTLEPISHSHYSGSSIPPFYPAYPCIPSVHLRPKFILPPDPALCQHPNIYKPSLQPSALYYPITQSLAAVTSAGQPFSSEGKENLFGLWIFIYKEGFLISLHNRILRHRFCSFFF